MIYFIYTRIYCFTKWTPIFLQQKTVFSHKSVFYFSVKLNKMCRQIKNKTHMHKHDLVLRYKTYTQTTARNDKVITYSKPDVRTFILRYYRLCILYDPCSNHHDYTSAYTPRLPPPQSNAALQYAESPSTP